MWPFLLLVIAVLILFYLPQGITLYLFLQKFLILKRSRLFFAGGLVLFYVTKSLIGASLTPLESVIVHFIVYSLITVFYFHGRWLQKIFLSAFYTVFTVIIELMVWFGLSIDGVSGATGASHIVGFITVVILSNGLCLLMVRMFRDAPNWGELSDKEWGILMLIPVISLVMIIVSLHDVPVLNQHNIVFAHLLSWRFLMTLLGLLLINIAVMLVYHTLIKRVKSEFNHVLLQQQVKEYKQKWQEHQALSTMRHDVNHMFAILSSWLENGQVQQAQQFILQYKAQHLRQDNFIASGNIVIDAIINEKLSVAKGHKIEVLTHFQVPQDLSFSGKEIELAVILGNALDNAIEGVLRLPNPSNRYIDLEVIFREGILIIATKNPAIDVKPNGQRQENTSFLSSKRKYKESGIGIKSICYSVEKLKGNVSFKYMDGHFHMIVTLPC
ncbi:hypothetical protein J2Z32_002398 [Paenibacillus turicensis]|uniref:Sensor histidine kinase NatK-like C-terminal domain-containing protein n=1 Tax=Paenibacillus turicensis TaxID=160487 RepID=A0ABS4FT44_9BACL|nr:ATP-binding protein [Paenibacillus turicensis]MBP1905750.1 hypothetical protein [Paenibacillus turicensis]